ncbi:hypothetical protein BKA12_001758 [Neomicrococcus lactis]|uniref:Uncharacterized protein n=1 Tax=Neomicrococcus lactis TaxID=732241 RepID=A0A7W8YBU5_9MICC|nr:hypothetical protein [Neomicrococcus lactis]
MLVDQRFRKYTDDRISMDGVQLIGDDLKE